MTSPSGLHVPLITPLDEDGAVDLRALETLAHRVLSEGADGLVALGTTGEPATLRAQERERVIDVIGGVCAERAAVLTIGAGSSSTDATCEELRFLDPRADHALVMVPPCTRPAEAGVIEHFRQAVAASAAPVIVYDVPYRTARPLSLDTLLALAALDGVAGFKHTVGAVTETTVRLVAEVPAGVGVLAGDDAVIGPLLALGGAGAIAASAHLATAGFAALVDAWREGRVQQARELGGALARLSSALFAEPNPSVIKGVLAARGEIASPAVRLPMLPASPAAVARAAERARGSEGTLSRIGR